ncbi:heme transporter HemC, partial [Mesorhizobium sp. M7A.F.Ca.AU.002.02.1.1]
MSDTTSRLTSWMDLANPTRFVGLADKVVPWPATIA